MANYLLLTPLFARVFSVEQFGVITNTYSWVAMMIIFFTYGLETGFFRYATSHEDRKDDVYSTAFISVLCSSVLLVGAIIYFSQDIANAMSKGAGVIRTRESLEEVLATLDQLAKRTSDQPCVEAWEVTNLHCLANVLVRSALIREETRGSHWREDFPDTEKNWRKRIVQQLDMHGHWTTSYQEVGK